MNEADLHSYQNASVDHVIKHKNCGLFLEMGLGKTVSTLTAINRLMYIELEIRNVLVIAPKRVVESVWDVEGKKWEHLNNLTMVKIIGSEKQRIAALRKKADIHLISRDNIAWLCGFHGGSMLPFDMLVIDELSSFKNPKSQRFKALRAVQPYFKRIVGLTGTPAPNGFLDLWSQMYLLDRGERLEKFITKYRDKYFKPGRSKGHVVYNYTLLKESEAIISEKIRDICISMSSKDYLELPERIENTITIRFPPDLQKKYDDFEKEKILELLENQEEGKEISATNAAALTNKLLQFVDGAIYDEDGNWHEIHDLKIKELKEIIEDANGKPILVARTFRHAVPRLLKAFKKYGIRELKDDQDIKDWNEGKIPIMVMHPASGGHGLNLQAGGHIIVWFGNTWSLELDQQFNARLDRQGQKNRVIIHRLAISKSVDDDVLKSLQNKGITQYGLMEAVKAKIKKYAKSR